MYFAEDFLNSGWFFLCMFLSVLQLVFLTTTGKPFNHFISSKHLWNYFLKTLLLIVVILKIYICTLCACVQENGVLENTEIVPWCQYFMLSFCRWNWKAWFWQNNSLYIWTEMWLWIEPEDQLTNYLDVRPWIYFLFLIE